MGKVLTCDLPPNKFLPHPKRHFAKGSRKLEFRLEAFFGSVCLFCAWHGSKRSASCEQIRNDECLRLLTRYAPSREAGVTQDATTFSGL